MEVQIGVHEPPRPAAAPDAETQRFGAVVDLLMCVGHVDGAYDPRSRAFVRQYVDAALRTLDQEAPDAQQSAARRAHADALEAALAAQLAELADEEVTVLRGQVPPRLRAHVLALFQGLPWNDQAMVLELVHALMQVDGRVSPAALALYHELAAAVGPAPAAAPVAPAVAPARRGAAPMLVEPPGWLELATASHPLLDPLEQTYSPHPVERQAQFEWDFHLIRQAMLAWQRQREAGAFRLTGITDVAQLPPGARFLDGFVHVMRPDAPVELIVLGDLHGCYSCLKAALLQSRFIERAWAHQWDPARYPDVKLVLLGDYIDRGRFSFDGVLRAALQLFVTMPEQVILLRGNHEWLTWSGNYLVSNVYPAEALASIVGYAPPEMLEAYRLLFEHMPTSFVCDRTLLVHGGIPRADTFERYRDLASLNDPELRFQMMWSDPVQADRVAVEQQRLNPRFSFGREQFRAFMERAGLTTMIRGHEQIDRGFDVFYDLGDQLLLTLFSAGGHDNEDLPPTSSYRAVTPMALTLQYGQGTPTATPWGIAYKMFNYEPHNGLYRPQPLLDFRYA
ncbi:MAG TPA: metallophosphoesterase family protein [Kofleriaceae bacterium]|nr:metallophosphoesterase family protein [Kofleriaceae bacterium]